MPTKNAEKQRKYRRDWYERNRDRAKGSTQKRTRENALWLREIKRSMSCGVCGFSHPAALDFHHRDPLTKEIEVSVAIRNGWSRERIMKEIAKCDVLCANCHRILHDKDSIGMV